MIHYLEMPFHEISTMLTVQEKGPVIVGNLVKYLEIPPTPLLDLVITHPAAVLVHLKFQE